MTIGHHRLQKSVKGLNKVKLDEITEVPGILGVTLGGQKLIDVPNREGYVYVRLRDNLSELIQAYNSKVSAIYDLPVLVYREKVNKTRWIIKGRDEGRYDKWGLSAYLPSHGAMHSFNPEAPGLDIVWVYGQQFMPLLAVPSGSNAGMNVIIYPGTFYNNGNWLYVGTTGTPSFAGYKPTDNTAKMVLITIDANGNPTLTAGSTFSASLTGTTDIYPFIPDKPANTLASVAAVRLVSGTSIITWDNLYDVREFFGSGGSGTSGGGVTDHGALTGLLDNDHPQYLLTGTAITDEKAKVSSNDTTAGYLNGKLVEGAGISLTEINNGSNETLRISYTGTSSSGGSGNIIVYDDNIFKVTGTAFSFNDGLVVHITGSVAYIDWTGSAGSQGAQGPPGSNTVVVYDNDTFKVTGTTLVFRDGLVVSTSGSIAYIDWTGTTSVGSGGGSDILVYDNNTFKVTGTAIHFNDGLNVIVTGSSAWIDWTGTAGSQGEAGPPGSNTLFIYDDTLFKVTGTSISFNDNLTVVVTGSNAYVNVTGVDISSDGADITAINFTEQSSNPAAPGAGHRIIFAKSDGIYMENSSGAVVGPFITGTSGVTDHGSLTGLLDNDHPQYLLTGTAITDEKVKISSNDTTSGYLNGKLVQGAGISLVENNNGGNETLTIAYTGTNCGTYQRVGRPIALASITGIAWAVPGYVYASGSLAVYANGSILTPDINYYEQFYVSGTYILNSIYATGTVFVAMWGVPCTTQVFLSTGSAFGITDSNNVQIIDSNDVEIVDSNG